MKRELCESAKKGRCCPDDLCHGADITLCGFDKDFYEREIMRDEDEQDHEQWCVRCGATGDDPHSAFCDAE